MFKQLFCRHSWKAITLERMYRDPVNGNITKKRSYKCIKCGKIKESITGGYVL